MKFKITIAFLLLATSSNLKAQILDTANIFSEIRNLKTDSMIDDYWGKLYNSDQDTATFNNPIKQTENLVKAVYFFKQFGFSKYNRFNTKTTTDSAYPEMHAIYIWIHNPYLNLNRYTFQLIHEACEIYTYGNPDTANYYIQNIACFNDPTKNYTKHLISKLSACKFSDIDIEKLVQTANEFIIFFQANKNRKTKLIGTWVNNNEKLTLLNYQNDFFILKEDSGTQQYFKLNMKSDKPIETIFETTDNEIEIKLIKNEDLKLKFDNQIIVYKSITKLENK